MLDLKKINSFHLTLLGLALSASEYFAFGLVGWFWLKSFIFIVWFLITAGIMSRFLVKAFYLPENLKWPTVIFFNFLLFGYIANIFTSWFKLSDLSLVSAMALTGLEVYFFDAYFKKSKAVEEKIFFSKSGRAAYWVIGLASILALAAYYFIFSAVTERYIVSPWQVLFWPYLILVALILFISFIFSFKKDNKALVLIVLASLAIHGYLLVYSNGFGGDSWRHIGSEIRVDKEMEYQPTLLTPNLWLSKIGPLSVPTVLISETKLSYGFEWSWAVLIHRLTGWTFEVINKYFIFGVWSIFAPLLFYLIGLNLFKDNGKALLLSALSNSFYLLQYYGAQTLPAGFGVLSLLSLILLWSGYLNNPTRRRGWLILFFSVMMYFGYSLAFLLALLLGLVYWLSKKNKRGWFSILMIIPLFLVELFSFSSSLNLNLPSLEMFEKLISKGDWLFFEFGNFMPFDFKGEHILSKAILILFIFFLGYSLLKSLNSKRQADRLLAFIAVILILDYFLSGFFIQGINHLSRRLNVFLVVFLVMIIVSNFPEIRKKYLLISSSFILALISTYIFATGPIMNAMVTADESRAMAYVFDQAKQDPKGSAVLANTWPLLALEAYSAKEIVLGNFPVAYNYQQPERVGFYNSILSKPSKELLSEALKTAKAAKLYIVIEADKAKPQAILELNNLLGEPKAFGSNLVWQY